MDPGGRMKTYIATALLITFPALAFAQVPVDDNGNVVGKYESQADIMPIGEDGIPRLSSDELRELVGPIALYPDDLLAIVLPASAYPLQVVEAARFLEALETDPTLEPDPDWDDSIVALINYPEVVELLNEDLDWTWRLGEAVVAQQTDVVAAVESFRDVAYAAGNLKSDSYQTVSRDDGAISISPTAEDVIYVPYYEPARVVHYQPRPVYYYYPRPYPVYYYPYAAGYHFDRGFFWGVTTAFSIGWMTDSLHVYHHSYRGHPYYGYSYWNDYHYRRPSINVYNTTYVNNSTVTVNRYSEGDRWRARSGRREYVRREGYARNATRSTRGSGTSPTVTRSRHDEPIAFRERDAATVERVRTSTTRGSVAGNTRRQDAVENASNNARRATSGREQNTTRPSANRQSQDTRRQQTTDRSRERTQEQRTRETREQAPARTRTQQAPAPARAQQTPSRPERAADRREQQRVERPRTETRQRSEPARAEPTRAPAVRAPESRSQPRSSNSSRAEKSERRTSENRSRSRDRKEH
jgi:hypothetical protein